VPNLKRNQPRFINKTDQIKIMGQYSMNPIISSIGQVFVTTGISVGSVQ